jgi:hypothetical protein
MNGAVHKVEDISEFLGLIAEFTDAWFQNEPSWGPWFRGEADAFVDLESASLELIVKGGKTR